MIDLIINWLHSYSLNAPLELLVFILAFIEEIIPPIPSFPFIIMIGSFAKIQEYIMPMVFIIALFSAAGKTLGGTVVYHVVDRLEDVFVAKYGKYLGIKAGQLEALGARLGKRIVVDYIVLTTLRATPLVSSALISAGCGLLKIPFRLFIISTYIGSFVRDCIYLYLGYTGVKAFNNNFKHLKEYSVYFEYALIIFIILLVIYLYLKKRKSVQKISS